MKKILVIDGNSIINRAFYGVRPLTTKSGKPTNAIFGMVNIISRQLNALKPDYAAVAFDVKHPTFRHEMYTEYKAGRHPTPDDLLAQFPDAKECLAAMGLHVLELPGYEADDIQGTVAQMAHECGEEAESYILTGDRDLLQLIDERIGVLLVGNTDTRLMRRDEFFEKYGVEPTQFVDMKALMGDSSDNIPGVGGVGEKTAQMLIKNFSTLDGIYENIDDSRISKGVREKLLRDKDKAYLSQKLAKINTSAPIEKALGELAYGGIKKGALYAKFAELELNSFITKFGLTPSDDTEQVHECEAVTSSFIDIDSASLLTKTPRRFALQLKDNFAYIYINEGNYRFSGEFSELAPLFDGAEVICYDAKALCHILDKAKVDTSNTSFLDLMLYAYVLNPGSGNAGVASLSAMFLNKSVGSDDPCPEILWQLEAKLLEKVRADGLEKVLFELEMPLINVLFDIEKRGFKIDRNGINEFGEELGKLADHLANQIYERAGGKFNINSPKQLGEVLFVKLGLPCSKKKKSGYSTDAETLEELRPLSPIIDDILEYRQVSKLRGTYTTSLTDAADEDGRIHTDFKQALTATGRLSSAEPNLQNIPIRTKMGREMRRYFIAKDGYTLVDADYSQIELRILAHISDDYTMKEAFKSGEDIHRNTAGAVFGVPAEEVTDDMRKRAKAVNFGIIYGIGGYSLAKDIGTSVSTANSYIKNYLMNYPGIDRYLTEVVETAKELGYTKTPMGRRRYIPELSAANGMMRAFGKRVAMNAPIQGAAADIMKLAMIKVAKRLKAEGVEGGIVMQVHDELIVEVKCGEGELCKKILKEEMESAATLDVPMTVDVTVGKNWLEQE